VGRDDDSAIPDANNDNATKVKNGAVMNLNKKPNPFRSSQEGSWRTRLRQFAVVGVLLATLSGCELIGEEEERGTIGFVEGFIGGVAVDEPRAALVGRDILAAGGTAADAAVAVYFTLTVTMPSSASLGGGGMCVVHDQTKGEVVALDFLARTPASVPLDAVRPSAIPGGPRGMFALHARYGALRWQELVAPGANFARFGTQVSRALARDLSAASEGLISDPEIISIFGSAKTGKLINEGEFLKQVDLSVILGRMGVNGPGDFYSGHGARQLVDAVVRAGGSLSVDDLRTYQPVWRDTVRVRLGSKVLHFAPPPAAAGGVAASMWQMLADGDRYADANDDERLHLIAETAMRAYADRARWMLDNGDSRWSGPELADSSRLENDMAGYDPSRHTRIAELNQRPVRRSENPSGTSFVTVDQSGNAVACALTMNNLFGAGRIAPGTGVLLATIPGKGGRGATSLGPMVLVNPNNKNLHWAGAASGGVAAPTALINVAAQSVLAERSIANAMAAKRVHHGGEPDTTYFEIGMSQDRVNQLSKRGHQVAGAPAIGRVNAMSCFAGLPNSPDSCEISTDPRGFGLAVMSGEL